MRPDNQTNLFVPSSFQRIRQRSINPSSPLLKRLAQLVGWVILLLATAYNVWCASDHLRSAAAVKSGLDVGEHGNFSDQRCADPLPHSAVRQTIHNRVFNGTSPWDNFPPPHVAQMLDREWTEGGGCNASVFEYLIAQVLPKTIIEVGAFLGASATHMAALTKKLGLDTQIICIDDFRGGPGWDDGGKSMKMVNGDNLLLYQFMHNVVAANATESIVMFPFSPSTGLGGLCEMGVFGDLVEIDAAQDFHSAWIDINHGFKVLRPGGVLFGHDISREGVRKAVHLFAKIFGFRVQIDGEYWILQ